MRLFSSLMRHFYCVKGIPCYAHCYTRLPDFLKKSKSDKGLLIYLCLQKQKLLPLMRLLLQNVSPVSTTQVLKLQIASWTCFKLFKTSPQWQALCGFFASCARAVSIVWLMMTATMRKPRSWKITLPCKLVDKREWAGLTDRRNSIMAPKMETLCGWFCDDWLVSYLEDKR